MLNCFKADNQCGSLIIKRLLATPLRALLITAIFTFQVLYNALTMKAPQNSKNGY